MTDEEKAAMEWLDSASHRDCKWETLGDEMHRATLKAMLAQGFQKMDLVTREEFDIQVALVERLRHRLDLLEARLDAPPTDPSTSSR